VPERDFPEIFWYFGTVLGGAIAGLSFNAGEAGISGIIMCLLSKTLLMAVFVPVYLLWSVIGRQKLWLSMAGSFAVGMLFFMMIPTLTSLNSGITNVIICLIGGVLFSVGLGAVSNAVLRRTSLV
ncbi:MAG TPA: hypothetical protein IAC64_02440, partial [Candidatus Caccomorpha excrementavium]|nr:hypothetical protein [Candidatus Caccomorpha excrementavium]